MAIDIESYYEKYGPMVLRRCRMLLCDEEMALDAMHDVFVKLLDKQHTLNGDAPVTLLFRMSTNHCLNRLRTCNRQPRDARDELLLRIARHSDLEARSVARNLLERIFHRQLPSTRTIAVMHLLDGLTLEEVAHEVGLSVSGVRKRLRKLKAHVKDLDL